MEFLQPYAGCTVLVHEDAKPICNPYLVNGIYAGKKGEVIRAIPPSCQVKLAYEKSFYKPIFKMTDVDLIGFPQVSSLVQSVIKSVVAGSGSVPPSSASSIGDAFKPRASVTDEGVATGGCWAVCFQKLGIIPWEVPDKIDGICDTASWPSFWSRDVDFLPILEYTQKICNDISYFYHDTFCRVTADDYFKEALNIDCLPAHIPSDFNGFLGLLRKKFGDKLFPVLAQGFPALVTFMKPYIDRAFKNNAYIIAPTYDPEDERYEEAVTLPVSATMALDAKADTFPTDFEARGYRRGKTWPMEVVNQVFNDYGYYLQTLNKGEYLQQVNSTDINDVDMFIINGISNDCFLAAKNDISKCDGKCTGTYMGIETDCKKKNCKWKRPYIPDTVGDNPRDGPHNWQHVAAIKKGKVFMKHTQWPLSCLHLDEYFTDNDGKRYYPKGFFYRIDKVYAVKKKDRDKKRSVAGPSGTTKQQRVA